MAGAGGVSPPPSFFFSPPQAGPEGDLNSDQNTKQAIQGMFSMWQRKNQITAAESLLLSAGCDGDVFQ